MKSGDVLLCPAQRLHKICVGRIKRLFDFLFCYLQPGGCSRIELLGISPQRRVALLPDGFNNLCDDSGHLPVYFSAAGTQQFQRLPFGGPIGPSDRKHVYFSLLFCAVQSLLQAEDQRFNFSFA